LQINVNKFSLTAQIAKMQIHKLDRKFLPQSVLKLGQPTQELGQQTQKLKVLVIKIFKNLCGNCLARIIIVL
jgi:hypothetical protein